MITAYVTVRTMTESIEVAVEIIAVFTTRDGRKLATVEALPVDGKIIRPFAENSHGGPCQSSTALIRVDFLKNIGIAVDLTVNQFAQVGSLI